MLIWRSIIPVMIFSRSCLKILLWTAVFLILWMSVTTWSLLPVILSPEFTGWITTRSWSPTCPPTVSWSRIFWGKPFTLVSTVSNSQAGLWWRYFPPSPWSIRVISWFCSFCPFILRYWRLPFCSQVPCPNPLQGEFPQLSVRCEQSVTVLRSLWTAQVRTMKLVILLILTTIWHAKWTSLWKNRPRLLRICELPSLIPCRLRSIPIFFIIPWIWSTGWPSRDVPLRSVTQCKVFPDSTSWHLVVKRESVLSPRKKNMFPSMCTCRICAIMTAFPSFPIFRMNWWNTRFQSWPCSLL